MKSVKADVRPVHLLFHILNYPFIKFPGGVFVKDSIFIIEEQHQFNNKTTISTLIQQTITAWLTKELTK